MIKKLTFNSASSFDSLSLDMLIGLFGAAKGACVCVLLRMCILRHQPKIKFDFMNRLDRLLAYNKDLFKN